MAKQKKRGKSWIVLLCLVAVFLLAALYILKFYADISDPQSLFEGSVSAAGPEESQGLSAAVSVPSPATPQPTQQQATPSPSPSPTPDPEELLSAQADAEFMHQRTNILVLGIDESTERADWGSFRTDTMILISIDFSDNDVAMVSIPRDSYVKIYNDKGELADAESPYAKINSAFSEGGGAQRKGFAYTLATVEALMGVSVDYYCAFNMNVVKEVIDAMGGVDYYVDVEVDMNGRHLDIGQQHLDGQSVLDYCRQRKGSSDIARIDRQQRMLSAILSQMKSAGQIANIPAVYQAVEANIMTNLNFKQICALSLVALRMDMEQLSRYTVEGKAHDINSRSCWCVDTLRLAELVKEIWGKNVTIDPEISYEYIQSLIEMNRQLLINELNAANAAYIRAETLLSTYGDLIDGDIRDSLQSYVRALETAIEKADKALLDSATPPVAQLCDWICGQYGISIY